MNYRIYLRLANEIFFYATPENWIEAQSGASSWFTPRAMIMFSGLNTAEIGLLTMSGIFVGWFAFVVGRFLGRKERAAKAMRGSHRALAGKTAEQWAPVLEGFPGHPSDARFLGAPIDYLVFDGLREGDVKEVVFVEVKSGKGSLSTTERRLRDCIREGRVRWVEHRVDAPG